MVELAYHLAEQQGADRAHSHLHFLHDCIGKWDPVVLLALSLTWRIPR